MLNEKDPKHLEFKRKLRRIGFLCLGLGVFLDLIGLISFFSVFASFGNDPFDMRGPSPLIGCLFIGGPLTIVGLALTIYSYIGEVTRYSATEVAPVAKDTINYMVDGTKDSLKTVVNSISEGIRGTNTNTHTQTVKCRNCHADNDVDAKFCDTCGKPIVNHKVCSQCQAKNELEAVYCNKCGTRFNK